MEEDEEDEEDEEVEEVEEVEEESDEDELDESIADDVEDAIATLDESLLSEDRLTDDGALEEKDMVTRDLSL